MPESFISTYSGIKYKVPKTGKVAQFEGGRLTTDDKDTIEYLKNHSDFGSSLTTAGIPRPPAKMAVSMNLCPECGKGFADDEQYIEHLQMHIAEGKKPPEAGPAAKALQNAHAMRLEQAAAAENGKVEAPGKPEKPGKK